MEFLWIWEKKKIVNLFNVILRKSSVLIHVFFTHFTNITILNTHFIILNKAERFGFINIFWGN